MVGCLIDSQQKSCTNNTNQPTEFDDNICMYCLKVIRDGQKATQHVKKLHRVPVLCPRCDLSQEDMLALDYHKRGLNLNAMYLDVKWCTRLRIVQQITIRHILNQFHEIKFLLCICVYIILTILILINF